MKRPNIVYILADDMGYGDVSALNEHCPFPTPGFDNICDSGIAFTDAHASSAVCTPSRYSILTGRYNWRSRLKSGVIGGYSPALIEAGRMTVANLLRDQGYRTAMVGKWHLGMDFAKEASFHEEPDFAACDGVDYGAKIKNSPVSYGFDSFYGISASLDMPPYVYIENDRFTALPSHTTQGIGKGYWRQGPTAPDFCHEEVLPHLTRKALEVIEEAGSEPFFLYFSLPAPHTPIVPTPEFRGKSGVGLYGDFVLQCDDVVEQVSAKLRECGLWEDTILIYTSDNGCSPAADFAELMAWGHNPSYHFRGHKADIYEGGHRVPLLVQWPAEIPPGTRCHRTVCLTDLMATLAELLGVALPPEAGEDSVSNLSLWGDPAGAAVREQTVHQSIDGSLSIRRGGWKLELCPGSGGWSSPVPGQEPPSSPRFQLYNLEEDIGETENRISAYPDIAQELEARLKAIVERGRSTPGIPQKNNGQRIWETVRWLDE